jgi:hypothetical protein
LLRSILIVAMVVGLSACADFRAQFASLGPHHPAPPPTAAPAPLPPPKPAEGLWAILDPGCAKPSAVDIHAWPHCASPFWISGDKAMVIVAGSVSKRTARDVSYAADVSLTSGDPVIAQVGTEKDGYLFLALTDLSKDNRGRLVGAVGAAIACPKPKDGGIALRPNLGGCDLDSVEMVRAAAAATLRDVTTLQQVAWIAPGNP